MRIPLITRLALCGVPLFLTALVGIVKTPRVMAIAQEGASRSEGKEQADVSAVIGLVERNYPGLPEKKRRYGNQIAAAVRVAREQSQKPLTPEEADAVIARYLETFQDGHLFLNPVLHGSATPGNAGSAAPVGLPPGTMPTAQALSGTTCLLTIPSFMPERKAALEALLRQYDNEIQSRPYLIIDVRGNHGGANACLAPLLPYVYEKTIHRYGDEVLVTREILAAWERVLRLVPPGEKAIRAGLEKDVARMRTAPEGAFVALNPDEFITLPRTLPFPRRVVILIDSGCASTTEQFLLDARASKKVILIGQKTSGTLDYGNIRPFPLPSGERTLWLPTTRSRRLPQFPLDGIGVTPDIIVAPPASKTKEAPGDRALAFALQYLKDHSPSLQ